jgi:transcription elongation factor GreB
MSKAFTKEDGPEIDALDGADDEQEDEALPQGTKNYITPWGAGRLKAELHQLLHVERPEVVRTVSWAASNGDRSENGDYIYGKRRLREIDRRIRFLTKRLDRAEIVDPAQQKSDRVLFGATVKVLQQSDEAEKVFRIVGIDETDVKRGHVSWISPVGKALLQSRQGDLVTLRTPRGDEELEVLEIRYESFT